MSKKSNKKQQKAGQEKAAGYGDKKLEGPNRPSE